MSSATSYWERRGIGRTTRMCQEIARKLAAPGEDIHIYTARGDSERVARVIVRETHKLTGLPVEMRGNAPISAHLVRLRERNLIGLAGFGPAAYLHEIGAGTPFNRTVGLHMRGAFVEHHLAEQHCGRALYYVYRYDSQEQVTWHTILDLMMAGNEKTARELAKDALVHLVATEEEAKKKEASQSQAPSPSEGYGMNEEL